MLIVRRYQMRGWIAVKGWYCVVEVADQGCLCFVIDWYCVASYFSETTQTRRRGGRWTQRIQQLVYFCVFWINEFSFE